LAIVRRAVGALPKRDREILLERCNGETQPAIARRRKVSKERVRQIERNALVKLSRLAGGVEKPLSLAKI